MLGISLGHLLILFLLVLLFGPKKLSTLAEQLGRSTKKIKDQLDSAKAATGLDQIERSIHSVKSMVESTEKVDKFIDSSSNSSVKQQNEVKKG